MIESRTYRQITRRLRIQRGPGHPDKVSERPYRENKDGSITYLDSDQQPTLITLDDGDLFVDVGMLLQTGAIVPWQPPAKPAEPAKPIQPVPVKVEKDATGGVK